MQDRDGKELCPGDKFKSVFGDVERTVIEPPDVVWYEYSGNYHNKDWALSENCVKIEKPVYDRAGRAIKVGDKVLHIEHTAGNSKTVITGIVQIIYNDAWVKVECTSWLANDLVVLAQ